jgi:hypothetical protein
MNSRLIINVTAGFSLGIVLRDNEVKPFCIAHLEALKVGKSNTVYTSQELVLYMFRALLCKEYKHLQSQVSFIFEGVEVKLDKNMRTWAEYPYSVYDECLCVLVGGADG